MHTRALSVANRGKLIITGVIIYRSYDGKWKQDKNAPILPHPFPIHCKFTSQREKVR